MKIVLILLSGSLLISSACAVGLHMGVATCNTCHDKKPTAEAPSLKYPSNPSELCRECHKYRIDADHHPYYAASDPSRRTAEIPSDFKLIEGKMECLTCHKMHAEGYLSDSKNFLLGGPYAYNARRRICFKCHKKSTYRDINPHETMLDNKNDIKENICLICHAKVPDAERDNNSDVKFRSSVAFLCWRCHLPMQGEFLEKHFLRTPGRKSIVEMRRSGAWFPLDPKGRLTCSTCHNPHQKGVLRKGFDEGAGEKRKLRQKNQCGCHEKK